MATVFFYAELWRRSGVMTDLEFYEIRYSGKAASVVRGFRAVYLGFFFNCIIMASVNLAACKIAGILFGLDRWQTLLFVGLLNVVFAAHSGLWGVLVIDMIQFFIKMSAVIAAAYFAVKLPRGRRFAGHGRKAVPSSAARAASTISTCLPDFSNHWDIAVAVFIMPMAVQWWSVWYPGCEPGGGSFIAQRMLASKSEKDALGGVLFFNIAHYCLRPWPWIIVALCSIIVYPELSDIQSGISTPRPEALLGNDIAYPAMLKFLPVGLDRPDGGRADRRQLLDDPHPSQLGRFLFGPRFLPPLHQQDGASEKHYVFAGRARHGRTVSLRGRADFRSGDGQR